MSRAAGAAPTRGAEQLIVAAASSAQCESVVLPGRRFLSLEALTFLFPLLLVLRFLDFAFFPLFSVLYVSWFSFLFPLFLVFTFFDFHLFSSFSFLYVPRLSFIFHLFLFFTFLKFHLFLLSFFSLLSSFFISFFFSLRFLICIILFLLRFSSLSHKFRDNTDL